VTKTHSRPHVSNDNPYSEAQFKTLKYRPGSPARFGSIEDALAFCRTFFCWHNAQHRHSGLGLMTPAAVHYGEAEEGPSPWPSADGVAIRARRDQVLDAAYARHPERFIRKPPRAPAPSDRGLDQPAGRRA
jgi:putative transposase